MFSEGQLHIALAYGEDVAKTRAVQLLQEDLHAGEDLFEKVESSVRHGRLVFNNIRQNIRFRDETNPSIYRSISYLIPRFHNLLEIIFISIP